MLKKSTFTTREIGFALFSVFCLLLTFFSFSVVNRNNSKIEKLLSEAEKESVSTISIPIESAEAGYENTDLKESKSETEDISASWNEKQRTFKSPDGRIVIDKIETVKDFEGESVLKISFTITNATNKEENVMSLFSSLVNVKQRNKNTSNSLPYAILTSSENNHLNDILNPNGTISGFYPMKLENEIDPVIFDFKHNYTSLYEWEYKLK